MKDGWSRKEPHVRELARHGIASIGTGYPGTQAFLCDIAHRPTGIHGALVPGARDDTTGLRLAFGASCDRPVATCSTIWACAARMPAASREWLHALDTAKSRHAQCQALPDSKLTRKRSTMYSLRTMVPPRPEVSMVLTSSLMCIHPVHSCRLHLPRHPIVRPADCSRRHETDAGIWQWSVRSRVVQAPWRAATRRLEPYRSALPSCSSKLQTNFCAAVTAASVRLRTVKARQLPIKCGAAMCANGLAVARSGQESS